MITEDYVSFEVAKLLKEKGFDEPCRYIYDTFYESEHLIEMNDNVTNYDLDLRDYVCYLAPTLQMACKWLREVHNIFIAINVSWPEGDMRNPMSWRCEIIDTNTTKRDYNNFIHRPTYEEEVEAAIKYVLENLI